MRVVKCLTVFLALALPLTTAADLDVPGSTEWYLHVDLQQMKSESAGKPVYNWLKGEVFDELRDEAGVDVDRELHSLTAFSVAGGGPVIVFDGRFSQQTRDKLMTFLMAEGDISPLDASGKKYYRFGDAKAGDGTLSYKGGDVNLSIDTLEDEGWISMDIRNKLLITGSEEQMKALLKNGGRVAGSGSHGGALLVLTAEKTLLQAGMTSDMLGDDGDTGWDSNILRNTEQVAFLVAAAANKLAIEAKLITTEPEMADSLASVVRGLISLVSFSDDMDPEAAAMLRGTSVEAKGNSLNISLAVNPELVVATIEN